MFYHVTFRWCHLFVAALGIFNEIDQKASLYKSLIDIFLYLDIFICRDKYQGITNYV